MTSESDPEYSDSSISFSPVVHQVCNKPSFSYERRGCIVLNQRDLNWKKSAVCALIGPNSALKQNKKFNLLQLLCQRELLAECSIMQKRLRFYKSLYTMNVWTFEEDLQTTGITTHFSPINKKSIYLGLSHDASFLLELSLEVSDLTNMSSFFDRASADKSSFCLIVHYVTSQYLYPCHAIDFGHRPTFSVFYIGFSKDQTLLASHSFSSGKHKECKGTYFDSVLVDIALLKHNIHIAFKVVVNYSEKKRQLSKKSYFRVFKEGILFDTGTEIIAVTFSDKCRNSSNCVLVYQIKLIDTDMSQNNRTSSKEGHGIFIHEITVQSCSINFFQKNKQSRSVNLIPVYELNLIPKANSNNAQSNDCDVKLETSSSTVFLESENIPKKSTNTPNVYMSETSLDADSVIMAVVRTVLKKRLQNFQFMGITTSEAHIIGVHNLLANILVIGVIEIQTTVRYSFLRLGIELDWDLKQPSKTLLVNLSVKEIDWLVATRNWHPERLPLCLSIEDRFLTNDVVDSLHWLTGSYPGGLLFSS